MATVHKEIVIEATPDEVWDAVRDYGAVDRRIAPGFVIEARLDGVDRVVTFFNGLVAREVLVSMDDAGRRLSYSAEGGRLTHHNASMQVVAEGGDRSRLIWTADLLPDEVAGTVGEMMGRGIVIAKETLEARTASVV